MICDFCGIANVYGRYECRDFASDSKEVGVTYDDEGHGVTLESLGSWAACYPCSAFIEMQDLEGLLARVMRVHSVIRTLDPIHREQLREHLRLTYTLFFKNKLAGLLPREATP